MTTVSEQWVQINGHKIAYHEQGEGHPVILIHGIPTSNFLWRKVMPELAKTHRVLAPDMLNYGHSDKPEGANVSIGAQSRLIVRFMGQLNLKSADLVGHDIGGGVAQLMALHYPERVRKLVLIDSVCFDSWPISEFLPLQEAGAEEAITLEQLLHMMRQFMPRGVYNSQGMSNDILDSYLAPWSTEEGKKALFRNFRRLNPSYTQAITDRLKEIHHKTLIIWAEKDVFQKPIYAVALKKAIPHAELIWIKEAGHWVMEDRPEELNEHLTTFLNGS